MGMLRPLAFVVAWAQPRICVRNPEAARPAIALPKKDLLFMRSVMLVLIVGRWQGGCGTSTRFPIERCACAGGIANLRQFQGRLHSATQWPLVQKKGASNRE